MKQPRSEFMIASTGGPVSNDVVSQLDRQIATEAIKCLKARYFRCMDTKDWGGLEAVFAVDAVMDMRAEIAELAAVGIPVEFGGMLTGRNAILVSMRAALEQVVSVHHGHMPEITVTSPTRASGIWAMEDKLHMPPGTGYSLFHGFGHYHETYALNDGKWEIQTLRLTRLRRDTVKETQREST